MAELFATRKSLWLVVDVVAVVIDVVVPGSFGPWPIGLDSASRSPPA